jgi:hypothetical protein
VFADAGYNGIEERFISNPNAANPVWINPFGNAAVANGKGSFLLAAGGSGRPNAPTRSTPSGLRPTSSQRENARCAA